MRMSRAKKPKEQTYAWQYIRDNHKDNLQPVYHTRLEEYPCWCEMGEMEKCNLDEIKYMIKNHLLLEIQLDNDGDYFVYIRQWKELPMTVKVGVPLTWKGNWKKGRRVRIDTGDLYLTDGKQIIRIWSREVSLEWFIQKCEALDDKYRKQWEKERMRR